MREFNNYSRDEVPAEHRLGYAEWVALGAVAAGSVGAIVGMAKCRSAKALDMSAEPSDPTMTAPHGDKLKGAVV